MTQAGPTRPNPTERDPIPIFLWWTALSSITFRGYGIAALIYFVTDADLEPLQLILLGTALEIAVLTAEIPTGVVADTLSRKWSIVVSHVVMGVAFVATGLTTDFIPLLITQAVWGVGFTFMSGADVAWITDELDEPDRIDRVLAIRERWRLLGGIGGYAGAGALAWATDLVTTIIVMGVARLLLGLVVVFGFTEHNFTRVAENRLAESLAIFRQGVKLARTDSQIFLVLGATLTINSGAEAVDRLFTRHVVDLGFPESADPVLWFTLLGAIGLLAGAIALRAIEARVAGEGAARRFYLWGAGCAVLGTLVLAWAPNVWTGIAGTFIVRGLGWAIIPAVATIWVNRRTPSAVRATVQSFLGQAESVGEISGGIALGALAQWSSIPFALTGSAGLFLLSFAIVFRSPAGRARAEDDPAFT